MKCKQQTHSTAVRIFCAPRITLEVLLSPKLPLPMLITNRSDQRNQWRQTKTWTWLWLAMRSSSRWTNKCLAKASSLSRPHLVSELMKHGMSVLAQSSLPTPKLQLATVRLTPSNSSILQEMVSLRQSRAVFSSDGSKYLTMPLLLTSTSSNAHWLIIKVRE